MTHFCAPLFPYSLVILSGGLVTCLVVGHILLETPKPSNLPEGLLNIYSKVCTLTDTISGHLIGLWQAKDRPSENAQVQQLVSAPDRTIAVIIDRWLHFKVTAVEAAQLYVLRERLASAFAFKVLFST
jgi:hypothetical protein